MLSMPYDVYSELFDAVDGLGVEIENLQQRITTQKQTIQAYRDESREWREVAEHAQAENAELRELVRDMWRFAGAACKKYPRLFDPAAQSGQMVQLNMIDAFEQRMRELKIKVDE